MSQFLTTLRFEKIGARRWLLVDELVYQTNLLSGVIVAPRGFQTDLASIPRIFWTTFPKEDLYDQAAVIHDAAYAHALTTTDGTRIELVKVWADKIFQEAMLASGVNQLQANIMYRLVSWFGQPSRHPLALNLS